MLVRPIASVDNGCSPELRSIEGSTLEIVAHDDGVCVVADHRNRVFERLSLGRTRGRCVREADDAPTEAIDCSLKT